MNAVENPQVDAPELFSLLDDLSKIGRDPDGAITRRGYSKEEREAHAVAAAFMEKVGLAVRMDPAGNTIGRWGAEGQPALIVGSHLDTVPNGGAFDGALGVATGITAAAAVIASGATLPWAVEVVAFADEEGAHGSGTLGSRAVVGRLLERETQPTADGTLLAAVERVGLSLASLSDAARPAEDFVGYLELHIEQGPILEEAGMQIGVVTGIPGIHRYQVEIRGRPDHAGTTPTSMRDDALKKSLCFAEIFHRILTDSEGVAIGNLGNIAVEPGAFNVVPSLTRLSLELRAADPVCLQEIESECVRRLREIDPSGSFQPLTKKAGVLMDQRVMDAVAAAADALGYGHLEMPSGAGHDASSFAPLVPTGMIFVPCLGGKSHCPAESVSDEAILAGAETLARTILGLRGVIDQHGD